MEVWYDTAKSSEGTQGCARCQSAGDGKTVRSVKADNQSYRKGRLFASVNLALTIAKVCGVTVEEVFYLQEEDNDGK